MHYLQRDLGRGNAPIIQIQADNHNCCNGHGHVHRVSGRVSRSGSLNPTELKLCTMTHAEDHSDPLILAESESVGLRSNSDQTKLSEDKESP